MTKYFSKLERIAAAAILAGLIVPSVALAKGKGSHHGGGNHSHSVRRTSFSNNHSKFKSNNSKSNQIRRTIKPNTNLTKIGSMQSTRRATNNKKIVRGQNNGSSFMSQFRQQNGSQNSKFRQTAQNNQHRFHKGQGNHKGNKHAWNWNGHHNHHWNGKHWNGKHWNGKHHWFGYWPSFWGGYYGSGCWTYPTYYYPPTSQPVIVSQPAETAPVEAVSVDLVLEDLQFAQPATALVGPAYRVKFRNQGMTSVGKFRVALLAGTDGQPTEGTEAIVEVAGLAAGQAGEITVRLPKSAMTLVGTTGQALNQLFVAIDIDGVVNETDEANNMAVVERAALEVAAR